MGKERENSYQKLKRSSYERHPETNSNISKVTAIFLNQKRFKFPSIHSSHNPLVAPFKKSLVTPSLSCVHIHHCMAVTVKIF